MLDISLISINNFTNDYDATDLQPKEYEILMIACIIELSLYFLLFLAIFHNVYKYLNEQKRFKIFTIMMFYILSTVIIVCRMVQLSQFSIYDAKKMNYEFNKKNLMLWPGLATYSKICIGWI